MKGYVDVEDLALYMGTTFSDGQAVIAALALSAAEVWLDHTTRHAWMEAGPRAEVIFPTRLPWFRVTRPPVVAFLEVSMLLSPGVPVVPLVENVGYYVRSLPDGLLHVPIATHVYALNVEYTPTIARPPDEIVLATSVLAAANLKMSPTFMDDVDPTIVQRYVVGGELEVEFRKNLMTGSVAGQQALSYLEPWTKGYSVI